MAKTVKPQKVDVESVLGGRGVVYARSARGSPLDLAIREGLPYRSFDSVAQALDLRSSELAGLIGAAPRTLARRKQAKTLSPAESDRLVGIARIASLGEAVLGSHQRVRSWLRQPILALGSVAPLACLDTESGRRKVESVLYQIRYGIIS